MNLNIEFKEDDRGFAVSFGGSGGGGYDEGYNAAIKEFCPKINATGLFVQCRPIPSQPFTVSGAASVTICGKNLYNKAAYPLNITGYPYSGNTAPGTFSQSTAYKRTGFIPVAHLAGQTIVLSHCPFGSNPGMAFYTRIPDISNKDDCKAAYCGSTTKESIRVPADAVYMVFCVKNEDVTADVQIEIGSVITAYEDYISKAVSASAAVTPLEGVNSVFCLMNDTAQPVTVSGTIDPITEIAYLNSQIAALSGAAAQVSIE